MDIDESRNLMELVLPREGIVDNWDHEGREILDTVENVDRDGGILDEDVTFGTIHAVPILLYEDVVAV